MDNITVNVRGTILFEGREGPRQKEYQIPVGWNIWDLVEHLDHLSGGMLRPRIFETPERFRKGVRIFLNGKDARFLQKEDLILHEGDWVLLLPLLAGG
ncbi:MAG: MoaD/ThiS family protein [Synergistales bacterium]|nr:MoaD/ThiS family protein [Synergistales bacterium]